MKTLFGTATISDIQELHSISDDLQTKNADIVHSLENQLSYVKRLGKITAINADAIANLSSIVKDNIIQSHDKFQQITHDIMWLNLTIYGLSEIYMAVRQLEFALLQLTQQVDDLFIAIQCVIQGNLSVKLTDPFIFQNILRNVTLQLPDGYKLVHGTKTENIHQYYQIVKVTVAATAHCAKLIISILLETTSHHFTLYKITTLPERITSDKFVKYSVEYSYLGIQTSQRDYILFSEIDFSKCSKGDIVICPADTTLYGARRLSCVFSLYFQTVSHYYLCKRVTTSLPNPYAATTSFTMDLSFFDTETPDVALPEISKPLVPLRTAIRCWSNLQHFNMPHLHQQYADTS